MSLRERCALIHKIFGGYLGSWYHDDMIKRKRGINATISIKAHQKMWRAAKKAVPRRSLREQVNFINNLPLEE